MIARPDACVDHPDPGPERSAGGDAGTRRRASDKLHTLRDVAAHLQRDAADLMSAQKQALADRVRVLLWSAVGALMLVVLGLTALVTATVLVLVGAAGWIGTVLGTGTAVGALAIGGFVLFCFFAAVLHGRRRRPRADRTAEAAEAARNDVQRQARRLVTSLGTVPVLLASATVGFVLVRLLRYRPVRRAAIAGLGALRRAGVLSRSA